MNETRPISIPGELVRERQPRRFRRAIRRIVLLVVIPLVVAGGAVIGWLHTGGTVSTDDAYVQADKISIVPRISGRVVEVDVTENQVVKPGQLLFRIDPEPYQLALRGLPVTKRLTILGQASKDFTTAATDVSIDTTAFNLSASLKPTTRLKFILNTGVGYAISNFLGARGDGREDRALSLNTGLTFTLTAALSASLAYTYADNHSNIAFSNFARHTASFTLSARY